ncbi:MAG: imidazole glycerol phosphate synthase subunit HisH [Calditrichaeota bacterium]|nr:MAG: imidazole glycerol phosphate synthase subunit HisH [Calditrichota bacterium]
MIAVIDYGAGNLRSVEKALEKCGAQVVVTSNAEDVLNADKIVFPGVGAFGKASELLQMLGFFEVIKKVIDQSKPFLGICLGMQLLFDSSEENPQATGIGIFKGSVRRFPHSLKVPHLGWNELTFVRSCPLWREVPDQSSFYFAHSYFVDPEERDIIVAETDYFGSVPAAVCRGNIFGIQAHPEKSQRLGLQILRNFVQL